MSNDRKSVLSAVFWKFAERIGAQLVSVIVSIVLTRLLSPDEYGIIPLVLVFITIANVFVDSGFGMSLIQKKDADDIDFSTVFYFSIAFSSFLYLILFFLAVPIANYYGMPILVPVLRVLAVSIVIRAINSVQQAYVARKMIFKKFFVATIIGTVTSGVVGIILAYFGFGVWALVFQTLINNFMDTVILQFTIEWRPTKAFSFKRLKEMFNFGWKLLLQSFVLQLYANLRSLVIGKIYTPADLAFYTKGNQFPDLISTNVDTSISTVLFPVMSQSQESKERVKALARKSTHLTSYIMNPIMIGFIVIAEPFILLLMTDKWLPAVPYLQIYCIALLFRAPQTSIIQGVKAVGRSDTVLLMDLPVRVIALIILFISIRYGVLIFAFSEILITLIGVLFASVMGKRVLDYSFGEICSDYLVNTLLAGIMGLLTWLIGAGLHFGSVAEMLIQIICGIVIYVGLSFVTKNQSFNFAVNLAKDFLQKRKCEEEHE